MPATRAVVACLGSSSTSAKGSFDWIADLQSRPQNAALQFLNFGVAGDLAYNVWRRLPAVIDSHPDKVVILLGANDALARVSKKLRWLLRARKFLPCRPSTEWFEQNLRQIVVDLKHQTRATIALCSLGPIGEAPQSLDPLQQAINRRIQDYSAIIRQIAHDQNVAYIPFHEELSTRILASPGPSLQRIGILPMCRDAFRLKVLRWTPDDVAAANGWQFHTDGIHLNTRGGIILANLVQDFIDRG